MRFFDNLITGVNLSLDDKAKSQEYYDRIREREMEFRGRDYIQNRSLLNAEDIATARQVLLGLGKWIRKGERPIWYVDPFHDEFMNIGLSVLYEELEKMLKDRHDEGLDRKQ